MIEFHLVPSELEDPQTVDLVAVHSCARRLRG
jgi:hypothetical protein